MSNPPEMAECKRCGKTVPRSDMFGVQDDLHCEACSQDVRDRMRTRQTPTLGTSKYLASKAILGLCLGLFVATDVIWRGQFPPWLQAVYQAEPIWLGEWWRHVVPVFLHGGALHIGMNMFAFWFLGRRVEFGFGSWGLVGLTLVTGITASAVHWIFSAPNPGVGLSGAIFGYCGFMLALRRDHPVAAQLMDKRMRNNVWAMLAVGFVLSWTGTMAIANAAHVGGLVSGFALGTALRLPRRKVLVPLVVVACLSVVVAAQFVVIGGSVPMVNTERGVTSPGPTLTGEQYRRFYVEKYRKD